MDDREKRYRYLQLKKKKAEFSAESQNDVLSEPAEPETSLLDSIRIGAQQGLTFGGGEEAQASLETQVLPAVAKQGLANTAAGSLAGPLGPIALDAALPDDPGITPSYDRRLEELRLENKTAYDERPFTTYGTEIATGFLLPGLGAAKLASNVAPKVMRAIPGIVNMAKNSPTSFRALRSAVNMGAAGAPVSAATSYGKTEKKNLGEQLRDVAEGTAIGVGASGVFGAAGSAIYSGGKAAWNATKDMAPRALARIRKIPEFVVNEYADPARREVIDAIGTTPEAVQSKILDKSISVSDELNQARDSFVSTQLAKEEEGLRRATERGAFLPVGGLGQRVDEIAGAVTPVGDKFKDVKSTLGGISEDIQNLGRKNAERNAARESRSITKDARGRVIAGESVITEPLSEVQKRAALNVKNDSAYLSAGVSGDVQKDLTKPRALGRIKMDETGFSSNPLPIEQQRIFSKDKLLDVDRVSGKDVLTPSEVLAVRRNLDNLSESVYKTEAGKSLPGKDQVASIATELRGATGRISSEAAEANKALSGAFDATAPLKRFGLAEKEVDSDKLINLFKTGDAEIERRLIQAKAIDDIYGTNVAQQLKDVYIAKTLNPTGVLDKIYTGGGLLPLAVASASGLSGLGLPYAAAQAPILTKGIIRGGVATNKFVNSKVQALRDFIGKMPTELKERVGTGVLKPFISQFATQIPLEAQKQLVKEIQDSDIPSTEKAKYIQELQRAQ